MLNVASSLWHTVWPNYVCDVAVPCGLRGLGGKCVCVSPCLSGKEKCWCEKCGVAVSLGSGMIGGVHEAW